MHDELSRKDEELFRRVVTNTYLACARRGEAAVRALIGELRTHAHLASAQIENLEHIDATEINRCSEASPEDAEGAGVIVLWNGHTIGCTLNEVVFRRAAQG